MKSQEKKGRRQKSGDRIQKTDARYSMLVARVSLVDETKDKMAPTSRGGCQI